MVEVMKLGVVEFLTKPCTAKVLLAAIQAACAESVRLRARQQKLAKANRLLAALTEREREVACLLANGHDTKAVATRLGLNLKTIEYHRTRMFRKLGVGNVVEMAHLVLTGLRADKSGGRPEGSREPEPRHPRCP